MRGATMTKRERHHFVVKHDLEALNALPHVIWRTDKDANHVPHRFNEVHVGDRWVSFAYIDNERDKRRLSQITGFSECVRTKWFGSVPEAVRPIVPGVNEAWFIEGEAFGEQPPAPVDVPPIHEILGKRIFEQAGVIPITADDFERLRDRALTAAGRKV
jgi:hypothetical protein